MSNYVQTTFFAPKDSLLSGNPAKLIKGADVDPEFAAIATAITSKYDSSNIGSAPILFAAGTVAAPGLAFVSDAGTGMYRPAASQVAFALGGVQGALLTATGLTAGAFIPTNATVPANGMFLSAANTLAFSSNTTLRGSVNSSGNWSFAAPTSGVGVAINALAATEGLSVLGATSGTGATAYMTFKDSTGARLGYFGNPGIAGGHTAVESDNGNIRLITPVGFSPQGTLDAGATFIDLGWRDAPQNVQNASYTFVLADRGKQVWFNGAAGQTYTVPLNATAAFPLGTVIQIVNFSNQSLSISPAGGVTLALAGSAIGGTRTMANNNSMASLIKVNTDYWFITGPGVS